MFHLLLLLFFLKKTKKTTTPKQTKTKQCFITSCVCCFFCLLHFSGSECCNKETQAEGCKRSAFLPYLIVRIKTRKIFGKKNNNKKKAKTIGCWRWVKHSTIFISVRNFVTRKNHTLPPTLLFKHHKNPSCLSIIHRAGLTKWFHCLSKKKRKKKGKCRAPQRPRFSPRIYNSAFWWRRHDNTACALS